MQCNTQQVNLRPVLVPVSALSIRTLAQLGKFLTDGLRPSAQASFRLILRLEKTELRLRLPSKSFGRNMASQEHRSRFRKMWWGSTGRSRVLIRTSRGEMQEFFVAGWRYRL